MSDKILLNGDDWKVSGWIKNQWRLQGSMELGLAQNAPVSAIQARVPGSVQLDLIRAGILPDPNIGLNSLAGEWVNNREWVYTTEFVIHRHLQAQKYILCFDGLDYSGEIFLNETKVASFSGMFIPVEVDITGIVNRSGKNQLMVIFYQSPEVDGQFGYSDRIRILKPRFNYTWDWCPRIVPVGIWSDVYIKMYDYASIGDFYPRTEVEIDGLNGSIILETNIHAELEGEYQFTYRVTLDGIEVFYAKENQNLLAASQRVRKEIDIHDVLLWWPTEYGEQVLYEVELILSFNDAVCDFIQKKVGFRKVEFIQNEGAPKDSLPYTLLINRKQIFIKGVNWVPISPFYGAVTREQYCNYLQRFKDMKCNLIRIWGGAILESKLFYDLCDEMGIMVWQEFPQCSSGINNTPPDDHYFLDELKAVAKIYLSKRRHHACHVIWCGGNELMWETWKPLDENHANIMMLKKLVEREDIGKKFLPTSSSGPRFTASEEEFGTGVHHDVHGPWTYSGDTDYYSYFNRDDSLLRSEVGCPGISRMETLEKFRDSFNLWPPDASNPYWIHRGAWWIQYKELTELFGKW